MPKINEATDTDPCLILAGTSLKAIYPIRKSFSNGVEMLQHPGWKRGGYLALSAGVCVEPKFVIDGIEDSGHCP